MASSPQLTEELALLEALPAFELFEREALQIIAFSSDVRQMRAGDTVFKMGQISDCGYLILSGAITLDDGTPLKGKNAGKQLVTAAVEYARKNKIKILPLCPFARSVFERVKEFGDVLDG